MMRNRDPEGAITLLSALPEDDLLRPETAYILAECYGMVGRAGDAASRLIDVAQRNPEDPKLAFEVAKWLERVGDRAQAVLWARKAQGLGNSQANGWIESLPEKASP